MWCSTEELISYIKTEYIEKNRLPEGADFFHKILDLNSPHRDDLIDVRSKVHAWDNQLRGGLLHDNDRTFDTVKTEFLNFLDGVLEEERRYIFVLDDTELYSNITDWKPGKLPSEYPVEPTPKGPISTKIIISVSILLFLIFIYFKCSGSESRPNNELDKYQNPLNDITTWNNSTESENWGVWLRSCSTLAKAQRIQSAFQSREIRILKIKDRYHLMMIFDTFEKAEKGHTLHVKGEWGKSIILKIDKCWLSENPEGVYSCY